MDFRDILLLILVGWHIIDFIFAISNKKKKFPNESWRSLGQADRQIIERQVRSPSRFYGETELNRYHEQTKETADLIGKIICADGTPGAFGPLYSPYGPFYSREKEDYGTHRTPSKAEAISFQIENLMTTMFCTLNNEGERF